MKKLNNKFISQNNNLNIYFNQAKLNILNFKNNNRNNIHNNSKNSSSNNNSLLINKDNKINKKCNKIN